MTDRKKPGVAFWATVVVVAMPLLYVLSFGPACWWFSIRRSEMQIFDGWSGPDDPPCAPQIYWPIGWAAQNGPDRLGDAIVWYATVGPGRPEGIELPTDRSGHFAYGRRELPQ